MRTLIAIALTLILSTTLTACATPPPKAPEPAPTPNKPQENLITDLAYMKAGAHLYSDDADPDWEGSEINLLWYDSKSNLIFGSEYKDITLQVTIEIFASKSDEYPIRFTEPVYKTETQVKYPFDIRIPFEDMNANPQTHRPCGVAKIVVHTPQQGDFSIEPAEYGDIFVYSPEKKTD